MMTKSMVAALLAAGLALAVQSDPASAADVTVKKSGTALRQAPTPNAPVEWRINAGFALTVVEEQGEWLKVRSGSLPDDAPELWVRANQVVPLAGATATPIAASESEEPIGYRIELTGTPNLKFKMECRIVREDGRVAFRPHFNRLPRTYEFSSDPLACFVWKRQHSGDLEVSLVAVYPSKERLVGHVAMPDRDVGTSILARSRGPEHPTEIFARSKTPWGPEAVVLTKSGSLFLPPSAFAEP